MSLAVCVFEIFLLTLQSKPYSIAAYGTNSKGYLMSIRNLIMKTAETFPAKRGKVNRVCRSEKGAFTLIAFRSYNYAMRMGNRCHTRVMIPQIWNMMLSNGLR